MMVNPLRTLHLENFGPHKDLLVEFDAGLNLIRARNRAGKSWILRAMSLLFYNYCPATYNKDDSLDEVRCGPPVLEQKAKFFRITATFANGAVVTRYRDVERNEYVVQPHGQKPIVYQAVGAGFFDPVGEVTGIVPLRLDGKTDYRLNIKLNTDPLFLLGESGQKQDDILTRLLGLNVISAAETMVEKDIREVTVGVTAATAEEAQFAAQVQRLAGAPALKLQAESLEIQMQTVDQLDAKVGRAKVLLQDRDFATAMKQTCTSAADILTRGLAWLDEKSGASREAWQKAEMGRHKLSALSAVRVEAGMVLAFQRTLTGAVDEVDGLLQQAERMVAKAGHGREKLWQLAKVGEDRQVLAGRVESIGASLGAAEVMYQDMLREAGVCPLCGQSTAAIVRGVL